MIKRKILIVDDEKYMLGMLENLFSSESTEVITSQDPEEALKYFELHDVDMVISDISMPKMQGTEMFFEMKKRNPFVQIIMITAYPNLQNIARMLEGGASDFIIKPFDVDFLKKVVEETFERIDRWKSLRKEWLQYKKIKAE